MKSAKSQVLELKLKTLRLMKVEDKVTGQDL